MPPELKNPITVLGYAPHNSIVNEEVLALYQDYPVGRVIPQSDWDFELRSGYIPNGTLYRRDGAVWVVKGRQVMKV